MVAALLLSAAATSWIGCGSAGAGGGPSSSAAGASFGVDGAQWPDDLDAARELLAALPSDLDGETLDHMELESDFVESYASASYGDGSLSVTASDGDFDGIPAEDTTAQDKLAAMFGLGYGCDMDTYSGSIVPQRTGPGSTPVEADDTAWFACRVDGAEGAEDFTAEAVGWTSGTEVAWLVVAPDEHSVRSLVAAMRDAADG